VDVVPEVRRAGAAGVDRDVGAGELARVERVLDALVDRHVAGDDGDRSYVDVRVPEREQQCDCVVGRRVGVDQERARS
jgi:hypothetical protein